MTEEDPPEKVKGRRRSSVRTRPERPSGRLPGHRGPRELATAATVDGRAVDDLGRAITQDSMDEAEPTRTDLTNMGLGRFTVLGSLGVGGMGEVLRVRDPDLNRTIALKILSAGRVSDKSLLRFREEAQLTAQLQHPGIVPVHEIGALPDGRVYYTMQEVRGRTLDAVIDAAHQDPADGAPLLRRLVDIARQACEAIAYAHSRGVIHRDVKPANIMVGEFGEVRVMDWGIAKALGSMVDDEDAGEILTVRHDDESLATRVGEIMGTPMFMSPEQARGEIETIGPAADVFALGAVLFKTISGEFPYPRDNRFLAAVQSGDVLPLTSPFPIPPVLREILGRAMAPKIEDRYPSATDLARALNDWLEGARARATALGHVDEAARRVPEIDGLLERARALHAEAARMLAPLEPYTPVEAKRAAWDLQARAQRLETEAEQSEAAREQSLRLALYHSPDLAEAHAALARMQQVRHRAAEASQAIRRAIRTEARLKAHLDALPINHPVRSELAGYLTGEGLLSLATAEPVAARLYRYEVQDRRLVEVFDRELGLTPLVEVRLPRGRYVVHLGTVRVPVYIERQGHWDGIPPGHEAPKRIAMPALNQAEAFVPGGPALLGDTAQAHWVSGFVIQRQPVSNADYLAFINGLVASNRAEDAVRFAPQATAGPYAWRPEFPLVRVSFAAAQAYAAWRAERDGLPWRLPTEAEWEKAARGVDARRYPWGNAHDPTWCRMRDSQAGAPALSAVDTFPADVSVYGVRGLAGNARDWVVGWFDGDRKTRRVARGGCYEDDAAGARVWVRHAVPPDGALDTVGLRLARSVDP